MVCDDVREESRSQVKQGFAGRREKLRFYCRFNEMPLEGYLSRRVAWFMT